MPSAPQSVCSHPGCGALAPSGKTRCPAHEAAKAKAYDRWRGTAASRGYDGAWKRLRDAHIHAHPLCARCEAQGLLTLATEVDHVQAVEVAPGRRLDRSNLQSLCHPCHMLKTAQERRAGSNA